MMDSGSYHMRGMRHFANNSVDHPSHAQQGITPFPDKLYVVTMLSNPLRWRSRYRNYWQFEKQVRDAGAILYTAEVAYGDRPFEVTQADDPTDLQIRTDHELWHKENALNLLIQRLPEDAKYIAWIDADITFQRPDWAQETMHLLQHYDFIQMFSHAHDVNENYAAESTHTGFMYQYLKSLVEPQVVGSVVTGQLKPATTEYYGSAMAMTPSNYWHPGFAWAARRDALNKVGMLLDFAILGSADWHMAWALIGKAHTHLPEQLSDNYRNGVQEWQNRAEEHVKRNVGYMDGSIYHAYHGKKDLRNYGGRWNFLINAKFDPAVDIKRDAQGLWQLSGNKIELRDGIRVYNRLRHEDK